MEIRVEERLTGRELRDRILERHGSRERLEAQAARKRAHEAQEDLWMLRLLEREPSRLDEELRVTDIGSLSLRDLALLTPSRLRLLQKLAAARRAYNVTGLARALGRDKKNVSRDVGILADLGLVRVVRRGRESIPRPRGRDIHIVLAGERAG